MESNVDCSVLGAFSAHDPSNALDARLTYKRTCHSWLRPTLEDVERFQNGSVHEFYGLKTLKPLKNVNTSDVEKITDLDEQNLDVEGNNKQSTTPDKE